MTRHTFAPAPRKTLRLIARNPVYQEFARKPMPTLTAPANLFVPGINPKVHQGFVSHDVVFVSQHNLTPLDHQIRTIVNAKHDIADSSLPIAFDYVVANERKTMKAAAVRQRLINGHQRVCCHDLPPGMCSTFCIVTATHPHTDTLQSNAAMAVLIPKDISILQGKDE